MKDIAGFYERMEKFFGMKITDGNIVICPLESITQFIKKERLCITAYINSDITIGRIA